MDCSNVWLVRYVDFVASGWFRFAEARKSHLSTRSLKSTFPMSRATY